MAESTAASSSTFNLFSSWDASDKDKTSDILREKVLAQDSIDVEQDEDTFTKARKEAPKKKDDDLWGTFMNIMKIGEGEDKIDSLVKSAREYTSAGELSDSKNEVNWELFRREVDIVSEQLKKSFQGMDEEVKVGEISPLSFMYYLETEDAKKNPSWKRRQHRFLPGMEFETVYALHDALYLAELSYVDSIEEIRKGIQNFREPYELVFATTEGRPREPAHFLAIKREANSQQQGHFPWSESYLHILLVVRGTKEMTDVLSDLSLEASPYRDGKAHDGVRQSGEYLVDKHLPLLNHLLEKSNRKKIKLSLVGHSLGAGAAAIACIEFNDKPNIEATCIGFGCPALVNKEMSESLKDKITTIVCDSDCVPRMSGATVANLVLNLAEHDWKACALDDIDNVTSALVINAPLLMNAERKQQFMEWCQTQLDKSVQPVKGLKRREIELYPPGKCVHMYRDGIGISMVEVPCTFFNEIDVARTMIDDHLIPPGYNRLLLEMMRAHKNDSKFIFRHDVNALRQEKRNEEETEKGGLK